LGRHYGGQKEIDVRKDEYESSDGMTIDLMSEEGGRKVVESAMGKSVWESLFGLTQHNENAKCGEMPRLNCPMRGGDRFFAEKVIIWVKWVGLCHRCHRFLSPFAPALDKGLTQNPCRLAGSQFRNLIQGTPFWTLTSSILLSLSLDFSVQ
jgi:hypothetical protein